MMRSKLLFVAILSLAFLIVSCKTSSKKAENKPDALAANLDTTINPANDFFMYANGGWIKKNPIPGDQSSWGIGNLVIEENLKRLREISEKAQKANAAKGTPEQKIGDFWTTAMDSAKIEADGLKPLQPFLEKVNAISDVKSLLSTVAELKKAGSSTLFSDSVTQDDKNGEVMTYKFWQGGIGLPEREYYFKTDSTTVNIRNAYAKYITDILTMSGEDAVAAQTSAKNILALETKLAQASRKLEDLRDPYKNYNKMAVADLSKMNESVDWSSYLSVTRIKNLDSVIVGQPEFFKALDNALKTVPLADWKSYIKFNLITDFANALPDQYGIASFNFNKLFSGAKERKPRWKRVISSEESVMGEMLGQLYLKKFFNKKAKKRNKNLVEAIRDALKDRIGKLTWMSDSTKQKAYVKVAAIKKKVGYPDKWKNFISMEIGRESYVQNLVNANNWWHYYEINKLGKPVDRDEWGMYPQTYNAYYNPSNNEIVLPAGIFTALEPTATPTVVARQSSPTFRHDNQHTGYWPGEPVLTLSETAWQFQATAEIHSSPVVVDGVVYFGSGDHNLYALDLLTGAEKWRFPTNDTIFSSPTVLNGVIYIASDGVYAVNASDGTLVWHFTIPESPTILTQASPVVVGETLYIASGLGRLHALDIATGQEKWQFAMRGGSTSSPAVADGLVYAGDRAGRFYAVNAATGELVWEFRAGSTIYASPAIAEGIVYIGSLDNNLYALVALTGEEKWQFSGGAGFVSSAAVVDGVVYVGNLDTHVYALDALTGTEIWRFKTENFVYGSATVMDQALYIGSDDGKLYALDRATGTELWQFDTGGIVYTTPAVVDGFVLFGSYSGLLVAVR